MYLGVIIICTCGVGIGITLFIIYSILDKETRSKSLLTEAYLLAVVGSILIAVWIPLYISCMYDNDGVIVTTYDRSFGTNPYKSKESNKPVLSEKDDPYSDRGYLKESKVIYILLHEIGPIAFSVILLFAYVSTVWEMEDDREAKAK